MFLREALLLNVLLEAKGDAKGDSKPVWSATAAKLDSEPALAKSILAASETPANSSKSSLARV